LVASRVLVVYVCLCNGVTDHAIRDAAAAGCKSVPELTMRTGVGANCGSCVELASQILAEVHAVRAVIPLPQLQHAA